MNISPKTKIVFGLLITLLSSKLFSMDSDNRIMENQSAISSSSPSLEELLSILLPIKNCSPECLSKLLSSQEYTEALTKHRLALVSLLFEKKERGVSLLDYLTILPAEISALITQLLTKLIFSDDTFISLPAPKIIWGGHLPLDQPDNLSPPTANIFTPDGKSILLSGEGLRLVHLQSGEKVTLLECRTLHQGNAEISSDGTIALICLKNSVIKVMKLNGTKPAELLHELSMGYSEFAPTATFSPDSKTILASDGLQNQSMLWSVESGRSIRKFEGTACFSQEHENSILTSSVPEGIRIWNTLSKKNVPTTIFEGFMEFFAKNYKLDDFSQLSDSRKNYRTLCSGNTLISAGSTDTKAVLWDLTSGKALKKLSGHTDEICSILSNPDGTLAIIRSQDKKARLWKIPAGELVCELPKPVIFAIFSNDGHLLLTCSREKVAYIWNAHTGELLDKIEVPIDSHLKEEILSKGIFSPDGQTVFVEGTFKLYHWELKDRNVFRLLTTKLGPLGLWFIAQASKAKKDLNAFSIEKNSFEYSIFMAFPKHVQEYLKNTYSIKIDDLAKESL